MAVTDVVQKVANAFKCNPVEGMMRQLLKKNVYDTEKIIPFTDKFALKSVLSGIPASNCMHMLRKPLSATHVHIAPYLWEICSNTILAKKRVEMEAMLGDVLFNARKCLTSYAKSFYGR